MEPRVTGRMVDGGEALEGGAAVDDAAVDDAGVGGAGGAAAGSGGDAASGGADVAGMESGGVDGARRVRRGRAGAPGAEELVGAVREWYERRGREAMTLREFERLSGYTQLEVRRAFEGGWTELRERAGMPQHPAAPRRYEEETLLAEFHRIAVAVGRIPRWIDFDRHGRISSQPYMSRFGGKAGLVERYREWLTAREPDSPLVALCDEMGDGHWASRRRVPRRDRGPVRGRVRGRPGQRSHAEAGGVLGEPIGLKAMQHAPTNEMGVVFVFGMLCDELGFAVQRVGSGFPDCEATRAVDAARTKWERVRIEFEHRSRNFREHGHDPEGCDLVVCWRHDWPECPVEVLELAGVVGGWRVEGGGLRVES